MDNGAGPGDVGAKFAEVGEASEQPRCFLELVGHGLLECQEVLQGRVQLGDVLVHLCHPSVQMLDDGCLLFLVDQVSAQLVVEVADLVGLVESEEAGEAGHYGPELTAKTRT